MTIRRLKTAALITALSLTVSLGLICFGEWCGITAFEDPSRYPIRYPLSAAGMMLSLLLLILLTALCCRLRPKRGELAAVIVLPILLVFPLSYLWYSAGELISGIWR